MDKPEMSAEQVRNALLMGLNKARLGPTVRCKWCGNGFVTIIGSRLCGKCREESAANRRHNAGR